MQNRKYFFFVILIAFGLLSSSCQNRQAQLEGFWENDKKILEFGDDYFVMYNKNSPEVKAYKGLYVFAETPSYAVKMTYKEYLSNDGHWNSLEDTELEEYTDVLLFKINNDTLETKVMGNGQWYKYTRIQSPRDMINN